MGVLEAGVVIGAASSAYSAKRAQREQSKANKLNQVATDRLTREQASEDAQLSESKRRTALGMSRARRAGTDAIFKEGEQSSANALSSISLG